jgi:DNA repair exonuclease SbcCD ATPase subunit
MARGITEADVHGAADALVAAGERPTVERIRAHLGTGSPNTVTRWLETWWQGLGGRLTQHDQVRVATANVPEAVAALAGQWWTLALDHAHGHAEEALSSERSALLDAQEGVGRERHRMEAERAQLRSDAERAHQAEQLAAARTVELERLVEQLQRQSDELTRQRDAAASRLTEVDAAHEALQRQLRQAQETARTDRETLTQHARATEDRAHAEVDRARQETKEAQRHAAALQKEAARAERQYRDALERLQAAAGNQRQELAVQQARADALEAQLTKLQDLPAALEAAWRQRTDQPPAPKPVRPARPGRARAKGQAALTAGSPKPERKP